MTPHAPLFRPGSNCWKVARADRAALLVDGEDYFRAVRAAMIKAERRIVMLSWDVDTRVAMHDTQGPVTGPLLLGEFIEWLVARNPRLHIYILRWSLGSLRTLWRGLTLATLVRWIFHPRIHLKLDWHHPSLGSVHRKVICIDEDTAFCGGIDVTERRWDTREHLPEDMHRALPGGADGGPWHDASMIVSGKVARALSAYVADRWKYAGGRRMRPPHPGSDTWPAGLDPQFENVDIAIARTEPLMPDQAEVREIEQLFPDMIAHARRWIYAESQYFASEAVADAIEARLSQPDCPEIVLSNPITADGAVESTIMQPQRAVLLERLAGHPNADRLRVYHPITPAGDEIYCHAKIMIIDNAVLRIGSANLNNRSMGFDSECDIAIDAGGDGDVEARIAAARDDLLAEHLSQTPEAVAAELERSGSLIAAVTHLSEQARAAGLRTLRPYEFPDHGPIARAIGEASLMDPAENTL